MTQKYYNDGLHIAVATVMEHGLPGFEFFIEADGKEIWSGMDLQTHYPEILKQYPDKELLINWRSFPVTWV